MRHFAILLAAILILAIAISLSPVAAPPDLKPGDSIVVLTGKTVINQDDGKPCRVNWTGFVSQTGPQDELYWFRQGSLWTMDISVINSAGNISWEEYSLILGPADSPKYQLCPSGTE